MPYLCWHQLSESATHWVARLIQSGLLFFWSNNIAQSIFSTRQSTLSHKQPNRCAMRVWDGLFSSIRITSIVFTRLRFTICISTHHKHDGRDHNGSRIVFSLNNTTLTKKQWQKMHKFNDSPRFANCVERLQCDAWARWYQKHCLT